MRNFYKDLEKGNKVRLTKWDCHPIDFNRETMLQWLYDSGFVEAFIRQKLAPSCPSPDELFDYTQEIWVFIIEKADRLVDIFQNQGKGKFTNFIKMIITNNVISNCSVPYRLIRRPRLEYETHLNNEGWEIIQDQYDSESEDPYKKLQYTAENPNDELYDATNEKLIENIYVKKNFTRSSQPERGNAIKREKTKEKNRARAKTKEKKTVRKA